MHTICEIPLFFGVLHLSGRKIQAKMLHIVILDYQVFMIGLSAASSGCLSGTLRTKGDQTFSLPGVKKIKLFEDQWPQVVDF